MENIKIIAEMAWAHDGQLEKAIKIMKAAKDAGADAIGIHVTALDAYMVPHYGSGKGKVSEGKEHLQIYQYLSDINLSNEDWIIFNKEAKKTGIDLCVMPNDLASLKFVHTQIKPKYFVVSAASFIEREFIEQLAQTNTTTFFRIGGALLGEIEQAITWFKNTSKSELILLHGFQNYPTKLEDTNIKQLKSLQDIFGLPVGLADHIDGSSPLALNIPLLAIPYGAIYLEKHITWDRSEKGEDFESALNPDDFKTFVDFVRATEIALGISSWQKLSEASMRYRNITRKRVVAAKSITEGKRLESTDLTFKRSDIGLTPDMHDLLLGRTIRKNIKENEAIEWEDLI
ncbi:TPA: N-acetylneuraminate synthase family protein [Legionella pneumophila]|uniref:N-acetylneuraminate synthase family protein n=1 Tax=Legionella pneumophila TaxID=446 RepID=UPI000487A1A7|nr:N-acetylneuraminate synthase family protein [Legionella pneumophila]BCL64486.1 N-acetylneuraminate synthase [Legionella pneumophila serogroup 11]VEB29526.1 N-acetylneuraminic acid synthetase [Legionella pneumophila]HAT1942834.1 hypothetical protein [Legionella pneumophila]HAT8690500.1 hypothetical protein [Legionella pneumophila]HAT8727917.1 hypothetical protein [Legionella pneumophila]